MKTKIQKSIFIIALFTVFTTAINAQTANVSELKLKTSAVCETCKETIEKALAFEKGVKKSDLDVASKIVTVTYNPQKTTPEKIRQAIANAGYDADDVKANPKSFKKLPDCCKKDNATH
jgi:periplasmic mercuric ion binding protein